MSQKSFFCAVVAVIALGLSGAASADTIAIGDADFEQSSVDPGLVSAPNNGSPWIVKGGSNPGGGSLACIFNTTPYYDIVVQGSRANVGSVETNGAAVSSLEQTLAASVLPNTMYTLQVDVAKRIGDTVASGYAIALRDGPSTVIASLENPIVPGDNGAWSTASLSFTTGATVGGQSLDIVLSAIAPVGVDRVQTFFDNVQLSYQTVPEPSVIAMLVTAGIGLICYAWRKRK